MMCALLFLATFATMIGLSFYGVMKGEIATLIGPVDGDFNICGSTEGYTDFKHLYLTNLSPSGTSEIEEMFKTGVCVKQCPGDKNEKIDCKPTSTVPDCNSGTEKTNQYQTIEIVGYCFPENLDDLPDDYKAGWEKVEKEFKDSQAGKTINDL